MSIFAQLTTRNTDEPHLRQPETRTSSPSLCILSSALDFVPVTRATREIRAPILRDPLSKNQSLYLSLSLSLSFSLFRKFLDDLDVSKDRGSATRRKERERERERESLGITESTNSKTKLYFSCIYRFPAWKPTNYISYIIYLIFHTVITYFIYLYILYYIRIYYLFYIILYYINYIACNN